MSFEITVVEADKNWDDFVFAHPGGTVYHHSAWLQVLQSSFGYHPFYLALKESATGKIQGVYPFMLVKSRLTGERVVSLPFSSYCAPLMDEELVPEVIDFALKRFPKMHYLELKFAEPVGYVPQSFHQESDYMTHSLDVTGGESALWKSFHSTSIRQRISRAEKHDLKLRVAESEAEVKMFYRLHMTVRQRHGLPPHPYRFFVNMWKMLVPRGLAFVPYVEHEGKMVAASMTLKYKGVYTFEYSASDEAYRNFCPNQILAWEIIKTACREGGTCFDFGRSSLVNTSLIEYKDRWGTKRHNLAYYYYPKTQKTGSDGSLGRRILSSANRLLPRTLLQLEGELIYPHLG